MLLSLVDVFRCPADHEETALVLSVDSWRGQRVDRGLLGCPFCRARYAIEDGVVHFRTGDAGKVPDQGPVAPDEVTRVQALLDLAEPGGVVLLAGRYAAVAESISNEAGVTCLVVDGSSRVENCVAIHVGDRIPLAEGALRAAACGAERSPAFLTDLVRATRSGGRLLGDVALDPPAGVAVLARDARDWVSEVVNRPEMIPLRRP